MRGFAFLLPALFVATLASAQLPRLTASDPNTPIRLQMLDVDVRIIGMRSITTLTMTFVNPSANELEGSFLLPLPEGASVTRYALDINGQLRGAVPVEKEKATEVFESIQRRKVDPGLLEKTEGNVFRTRIYPLPANGVRTILIAYEQDLAFDKNNDLLYHFPFDEKQTLDSLHLSINILQRDEPPILESSPVDDLRFALHRGRYCTEETRRHIRMQRPLTIRIKQGSNSTVGIVQQSPDGYYFFLHSFTSGETRQRTMPQSLAIVWDCSLSGLYRDVEKELTFLRSYMKYIGNATIFLYIINNRFEADGSFNIIDGRCPELEIALRKMSYDGGTDFSKIAWPAVDETLLFSDGSSTLSEVTIPEVKSPVHSINSSARANYAGLRKISLGTGGHFIDLQIHSAEAARGILSTQRLQFLGIKNSSGVSEIYPAAPTPVQQGISLAGKLREFETEITLQFGYGRRVTMEQSISLQLPDEGSIDWNIEQLFAQKKIEALELDYDKNAKAISDLGKKYSIVTRNTSLLVLESVEDYVQYGIEPPLELEAEYNRLVNEKKSEQEISRKEVLDHAEEYSKQLREWWATDFPLREKPVRSISISDSTSPAPMNEVRFTPPVPRAPVASFNERDKEVRSLEYHTAADFEVQKKMVQEVVVTSALSTVLTGKVSGLTITSTPGGSAYGGNASLIIVDGKISNALPPKNKIRSMELMEGRTAVSLYGAKAVKGVIVVTTKDAGPQIHLQEKTSSADYVKKIRTIPASKQYMSYLQLRENNLLNPNFYYDMANVFTKTNPSLALRILTNLGELDFENHELCRMFAYKLKELGDYDGAAFLFAKVIRMRPEEPQSYRDYALALIDKKQYQSALDTLYLALTRSYSDDAMERFNGIEEVIVTEMNHLVSLAKNKLITDSINKDLLHPMPVDVRVVLNWNMNDTDIDLWVTDPKGETCMYSNPRTKLGGRISNDFTEGYGPEQFLLKKATKGRYTIKVDYYGESRAKLAGKTTLMAEVFTNYGRPNELRRIITLQLEDTEQDGEAFVGSFEF